MTAVRMVGMTAVKMAGMKVGKMAALKVVMMVDEMDQRMVVETVVCLVVPMESTMVDKKAEK